MRDKPFRQSEDWREGLIGWMFFIMGGLRSEFNTGCGLRNDEVTGWDRHNRGYMQ